MEKINEMAIKDTGIMKLLHGDCLQLMKGIPDESVDVILTDPPYKYLKNQKLEVDFDEQIFFNHAKRVLKAKGFIVLFGRGTSFYRWNTILTEIGFNFKEEIIWNKRLVTSSVTPIARKHETIAIFSKASGSLNKVKIDFFEKNKFEPAKILEVVNRIKSTFGNRKTFDLLQKYFENGYKEWEKNEGKFCVTRSKNSCVDINRTIQFVATMEEGIREQSIIDVSRDHYNTIHPTQKPVRLLERLLALTSKEGDLIMDPFAGSGSTALACQNLNRDFIGYEIDKEYYEKAKERIGKHVSQLEMKIET